MSAAEAQADRQPTDAEKQDAARRLERLRKSISEFHKARLRTGEYLMGLRKMRFPQAQGIEVAESLRSPSDEEQAVAQLRALNQILLGRDPTVAEMEAGVAVAPAEGLGWLPLLPASWIAVTAIVGGSWSLSSLFDALTAREQRIQRELNPSAAFWSDVANQVATYALPVALIGGVVILGWWLYRKAERKGLIGGKKRKRPAKRLPAKKPAAEKEKEE